MINQRLIYFPFTYDGLDPRYNGMTVNIFYCLLSSSNEGSQDSRCRFATATAAVSIGLGLLWNVYSVSLLFLRWKYMDSFLAYLQP